MHLEVVTPLGPAVNEEVDEVVLPGAEGEFGVLPGHMALLATLRAGVARYHVHGGSWRQLAVAAGYAEVADQAERVLVLVQASATAEQVDAAQLRQELADLERQIADASRDDIGASHYEDLEKRTEWASAQLAIGDRAVR